MIRMFLFSSLLLMTGCKSYFYNETEYDIRVGEQCILDYPISRNYNSCVLNEQYLIHASFVNQLLLEDSTGQGRYYSFVFEGVKEGTDTVKMKLLNKGLIDCQVDSGRVETFVIRVHP